MPDQRPDPDQLLARVQAEEPRTARGKLKVFFGAAPGVGKTYAMLEAARKAGKEGADVVVGYIEPHARSETQALVLGLDVLPRREVEYRGAKLYDFDLDAALALRPQLLIVDELAHTNAPGSAHAKRWQDVEQLLDAGIDVYTTLNVQHLESLNDVVAQITGVTVRETIPDRIFEQADEVELVDLAPDDLLERMREGKVYIPDQAQRAIEHFFQKGNLIALRELALRATAQRVDAQMTDYRRTHAIERTWPAGERLLVCVSSSPMSSRLVRATRRMASSLKSPWTAVYVETPASARMSAADRERLAANLHLAEQLGGETATLSGHDVAEEVVTYARGRNVTKIIVGKPQQSRLREFFRGSYVYELTRRCGDIDVYVISGDSETAAAPAAPVARPSVAHLPYLYAALVVLACTAVGWLMFHRFAATNIVMVYLLGVLGVALWFGRGPSILASVLGVAAFDFFFIPPHLTFAVEDTEYLFTFTVMLVTGLVISTLTARLKFQAEAARGRERRASSLNEMSRQFTLLEEVPAIVQSGAIHIAAAADADVCVLLPGLEEQLIAYDAGPRSFHPSARDEAVALWVLKHGQMAGMGTGTLPGADALYLPLEASRVTLGVLGIKPPAGKTQYDPEHLHHLETLAGLLALAVERTQLAQQSEQRRVQVEAERLRNWLLSTVSHDLRTPLAAIAGASSTLLETDRTLDPATRRELAQSIYEETDRLNRLVANLLDMSRLEGGNLTIKKEWQTVDEIIGVVLHRLAGPLAERTVQTHVPPELPLVAFDDLLVQQVLVNLLENAVKYSPPGAPIDISVESSPGEITVAIADRGHGLRPGDETRVFDKFYRGNGQASGSGAGLGLAICRGIVELHGGRIWAENRPGGGAVFRFTLPIDGTPPAMSLETAALETAASEPPPVTSEPPSSTRRATTFK
jgi:two-component system sensor histidine kinase KdpD